MNFSAGSDNDSESDKLTTSNSMASTVNLRHGFSSPTISPALGASTGYFARERYSSITLSGGITDFNKRNDQDIEFAHHALAIHSFFGKLPAAIQHRVAESMARLDVRRNTDIVAPHVANSLSECIILIRTGKVQVTLKDGNSGVGREGVFFNEEIVFTGETRIAHAVCEAPCTLLVLHWQTYQEMLVFYSNEENIQKMKMITAVSFFDFLTDKERMLLADSLLLRHYQPLQVISQQGETVYCMYIISQGSVDVLIKSPVADMMIPAAILQACNHFSEFPLAHPLHQQIVTYRATEPTSLYLLSYDTLLAVLGGAKFQRLITKIGKIHDSNDGGCNNNNCNRNNNNNNNNCNNNSGSNNAEQE